MHIILVAMVALPLGFVTVLSVSRCKKGGSLADLPFVIFALFILAWVFFWSSFFLVTLSRTFGQLSLILMLLCFAAIFVIRKLDKFIDPLPGRYSRIADLPLALRRSFKIMSSNLGLVKQHWIPYGLLGGISRHNIVDLDKLLLGLIKFAYLVGFPVTLGAVILLIAGEKSPTSVAVQIYAVFSFTTIALTLCPGLLLTWFVLYTLSRLNVIGCKIRLTASVRTMASWSGSWAAVTFFLGLTGFALKRMGFTDFEHSDASTFPLDALVVYPLIGASLGFVAGSLHAVMETTRSLPNHLIGFVVPPTLLVVFSGWLSHYGFNPQENAKFLLEGPGVEAGYKSIQDEGDFMAFMQNDPAQFLRLVDQEGGGVLSLIPEIQTYLLLLAVLAYSWSLAIHIRATSGYSKKSVEVPPRSS